MPRTRAIALIAALAFAASAAVSLWRMTLRIQRFHAASGKQLYAFKTFEDDDFTFLGRPVRIEDAAGAGGEPVVRVTYGEDSIELVPTFEPLGSEAGNTLARHVRWLRLLGFVPRRGMSIQEAERAIREGTLQLRLVLVARRQRAGADPETRGEVERSGWRFDFYEFLPGGGLGVEHLRYPESQRSLERRQRAAKRAGQPVPQRRTDELVDGTWQFAAALHVMPSAGTTPGIGGPAPRWTGDAIPAMGWTLPASSLSLTGLVIAIAVALAPTRRRRVAPDPAPLSPWGRGKG